MEQIYDMIVIGGGPAGYTAALYAARAGLSTLVLEKLTAGGQMALTERIDNYPGFAEGIDGFTLGERMQQGAERFGAVTEYAEVYAARLSERVKTLETDAGVFRGRTVVIAAGASPRTLGIPGEDTLVGRGVHYCAACDGAFYQGKTVAVVGGGNSAAADALTLSRIAQKVYLIHRRDSLRATKVYHQPLLDAPNVELCWNSTVAALLHGEHLTGLRLRNTETGTERELACDGVFVSVGRSPATALFREELALDDAGYIAADALTLSRIAQKVYLIHRRDSLRATKVYHEPLMNAPNVEFCWNSTVSALLHDSRLTGLQLKDVNTDAEHDLACDGVFISVGRAPATELFRRELALDRSGYIMADESTRTNLPGVFAVGDVRTKALRQVVTAVSDGAVAVHYAEEYLAENR